jgi:hypothetical protein
VQHREELIVDLPVSEFLRGSDSSEASVVHDDINRSVSEHGGYDSIDGCAVAYVECPNFECQRNAVA